MVINWKQARVLIIPLIDIATKQIEPTGRVILLPGMNEVSEANWKICKQHLTKHDFLSIEEIKSDVKVAIVEGLEKSEKKNTKEFHEFPIELAEKAIDDCFDMKTLNAWKKKESRPDIRAMILSKIDKIKNRKNDLTIDVRDEE